LSDVIHSLFKRPSLLALREQEKPGKELA